MDDELSRFKKEINLSEYAAHRGYQYDKKKSYRNVIVMKNGGEILNISKAVDGNWIYHAWPTEKGGSIIDLVQVLDGKNLGEIRKELRPWIGENGSKPNIDIQNYQGSVESIRKDRERVLKEVGHLKEISAHPYLKSRGIETLDTRFLGKVFIDQHNNAVFPHLDREGIVCLEKRNYNFKGMGRGGEKGLWCSHAYKTDNRLLIAEAPIDAMSYHEIKPHPETRYITFGGRMNPKQIELLKSAINRMPDHAEIILATDKGKTGDMFADSIAKLSDNKTHVFTRDIPLHGKDWNNHLTYIKGIKIRDFGSKELDGKGVSK